MHARYLFLGLILTLGGCVHSGLDRSPGPRPEGAPDIRVILGEIRANSRAIKSLEFKGYVRVRLPGEVATQGLHGGIVQYQYPDHFYMKGRKGTFRIQAYAEGERFLVVIPSENTVYLGREGDRFDDGALAISPSQMLQELFLLNLVSPKLVSRAEIVAYDEDTGTAYLDVYAGGRRGPLERKIVAVNEGGWRVQSVSVLEADGTVLSHTTYESYTEIRGIAVPEKVSAEFMVHDAEIGYRKTKSGSRMTVNPPLDIKTIEKVRAEMRAKGYTEKLGIPQRENLR